MSNKNIDPQDLITKSYHYDLPAELIAQRPIDGLKRAESRLLVYKQSTGEILHKKFHEIGEFLPRESLIVFNQSKVFPSRLIGAKKTGGKAEVFLLSSHPDAENEYEVLIKTRAKKKIGDEYFLPNDLVAKITNILDDGTFKIKFSYDIDQSYLEKYAKIPIPPYIRDGESDEEDRKNYQTVYAKHVGSVAAPTAGLHFTSELLQELKSNQIDEAFVTLHVGIGTFRPVTADNIKDHNMHFENFFVDQENFNKIKSAKKVFAVGTTTLRVLESMQKMDITPNQNYSTNIFLHPGIDVKSINGLITNFHLPESTLLMLVSALIGREKALELYNLAVKERYRFFSYGDAMLIML